jgi:ribosomal-protein-serine acetyltransferase
METREPDRPAPRIGVADVLLERWREEDLEPLASAISASIEELRPWLRWVAEHDRDAVARYLILTQANWAEARSFEYGIRGRRGEILGGAGLVRWIAPGGLEIGYWVHSAHTRQGIATRAAAALAGTALSMPSVDHVEIIHDEANVASGAVPERLGFRRVETFASTPGAPAEVGRDVRWRLQAQEFPASPAGALFARGATHL